MLVVLVEPSGFLRHDITEILLKVALNTIKPNQAKTAFKLSLL